MKHKILLLPENKILTAEHGEILLDALTRGGILLPAACGGRGTCGKCKVTLVSGQVDGATPDENGQILSCHAHVAEDLTLLLPPSLFSAQSEDLGAVRECAADVLLDVGTTTLAMTAIDPENGEVFFRAGALNPQGACGADVLSRIKAFGEGKGALLQRLVLDAVGELLERVIEKTKQEPARLIVAANPTMLHLFLGVDPSSIGTYPFTPQFRDTQRTNGRALGLPVNEVILLPFPHAYIGSDVTAGVLSVGMHTSLRTQLLVDVGTNGEIVLSHRGQLYAASCAAGPALEGACIECGMGGVAGAVSHIREAHGTLFLETVEGAAPIGICGSGLIDLIAILVREGLIDESGAWDEGCDSALASHLRGDRFYLTDDLYLSQGDIRQFQLAKSAIAAGIVTLLSEEGVSTEDVEAVYLAGGLGFYMSVENAIATGLLPAFSPSRIHTVGNSAIAGAYRYAREDAAARELERISEKTEVLELSLSPRFSEEYIERMSF